MVVHSFRPTATVIRSKVETVTIYPKSAGQHELTPVEQNSHYGSLCGTKTDTNMSSSVIQFSFFLVSVSLHRNPFVDISILHTPLHQSHLHLLCHLLCTSLFNNHTPCTKPPLGALVPISYIFATMSNLLYDMASSLASGWRDTAANATSPGGPVHDLIDPKQISILDALKELSGIKMATDIEIPQLIVVGDQSTGKSSVLEAIGRFHFPVADRVCTQFPTKLILRRSLERRTLVTIEPAASRIEPEKELLKAFRKELSKPDEFAALLDNARAVLGVPATASRGSDSKNQEPLRFVEDVLVVSSSGPDLAQVDLIDLPGLFTAETQHQDSTGMKVVNNMVRRYIQSQNSLVLLVVSLATSFANHAARAMIQDLSATDRSLEGRVIGVMTNPDRAVSVGEALEVLDSTNLTHPWIVVKNQSPEERARESLGQRDSMENRFFLDHSEWKEVPESQRGIGTLRSTLRGAFLRHTEAVLPGVIDKIEDTIERVDSRLAGNVCRSTDQARRLYLHDVARRFANITREACRGTYQNGTCKEVHKVREVCRDCAPFFTALRDESPESLQRNLRARVRLLSRSFAFAMRQYGKTDEIVAVRGGSGPSMDHPASKLLGEDFIANHYTFDKPKPIEREDLDVWLTDKVSRWRGREPQGEVSENLYHLLFMHQSEKWVRIASNHLEAVWSAVRTFVDIALCAACPVDDGIRAAIHKHLIQPSLKQLERTSNRVMNDLLNCRADGNTGFYDGFVDIDPLRQRTRHLSERLDKSAKAPVSTSSKKEGDGSVVSPLMGEMFNFILKSAGSSAWLQASGILVNQLARGEVLHQLGSVLSAAFHENENKKNSSNGAAGMSGSGRASREQANFILVPTSMDSIAAARAIEHVEMFYEVSLCSLATLIYQLLTFYG